MILVFGILLISFTLILTLSLSNLRLTGGYAIDLYEGPYQLTNEALGIRRHILSIDQNIAYAVIEKDISSYEADINDNFNILYEDIEKIKNNPEADTNLAQELEISTKNFQQEYDKVHIIIDKGNKEEIENSIVNENSDYFSAYLNVADNSEALYETEVEKGHLFKDYVSKNVKKVWIICVLMSVCATIFTILLCIYITRKIKEPIEELEIAANKMALGDFDIEIAYESEDELGSLSNSMLKMSSETKTMINDMVDVLKEIASGNFNVETSVEYIGIFNNIEKSLNQITSELSNTMSQINSASQEVQAASDQVASGAQMLSQGTTEQAGSIEELSATILDISNKAKELSLSAGNEVENGNEQMKQMVTAMDEISLASNEIGRIIKTIDQIMYERIVLIEDIAQSSDEEAGAINQVTLGIEQISAVVQTNSATSEESAAASEELGVQAQVLKSLIDDFNLKSKENKAVLDFNI